MPSLANAIEYMSGGSSGSARHWHWRADVDLRGPPPKTMSTKFHPSLKALIGVTQPRDNLGSSLEILD